MNREWTSSSGWGLETASHLTGVEVRSLLFVPSTNKSLTIVPNPLPYLKPKGFAMYIPRFGNKYLHVCHRVYCKYVAFCETPITRSSYFCINYWLICWTMAAHTVRIEVRNWAFYIINHYSVFGLDVIELDVERKTIVKTSTNISRCNKDFI